MNKTKKILIISRDKNLRDVLNFCFDGWGYEVILLESTLPDTTPIKKMAPDVIVADVHSATKGELAICRMLKEDFLTAFIPMITLINKRQLRSQLLNLKQGVDDYLIKPPDPLDLRVRVEMAMRRAQYSFHSSPLTGLPGGRVIEETLKERVRQNGLFSFGYLDIDNFKCFNDSYGYIKGDRVIMQSAYILYTTVRKFGNPEDFIGHVGGDDFVFITTPDRHRDVCHNFIETFDRTMPFHYSAEDRSRGWIKAADRTHKVREIPLMSVSVAVVARREPSELGNVIEINEKVAEIKRYLKEIPGSKFMEDRRNRKGAKSLSPEIYKRQAPPSTPYRPLGQIMLERGMVSPEELDEALCAHWKRGVAFGEIARELGFVENKELEEILKEAAI